MAKAPLKQLSVNTFEHNRILSPKSTSTKSAQLTSDGKGAKKKAHVVRRLNPVEEPIIDVESILHDGLQMSTNDFESHVQKIAPGNYWPIMAEYYRRKLDEATRENQQLHEIVDELNKDNEQLRSFADHCEYLTKIIEKLSADDDDEVPNRTSVRTRLF